MRRSRSTAAVAALALVATALSTTTLTTTAEAAAPVRARHVSATETPPAKQPTAVGLGGAVSSVDADASRIGLRVLERGGNAVDAAVATAAALGVTEPYSAGIGGGGYFVHYNARTGRVATIDGRETAPRTMPRDAFIDPASTSTPKEPYRFSPELVTSGVSVGTPGTLATWRRALARWGTRSLARSLRPAARLARRGFVVDQTFRDQTRDQATRFRAIRPTKRLFLRGGHLPTVGSRFRNPDLADTYELIARRGTRAFYEGRLAGEIVKVVRRPPKTRSTELPVPPGYLTRRDLAGYAALDQAPTRVDYRGYEVYGMAPSSSGGTTVGEALNILERYNLTTTSASDVQALHLYLEASALAFADRAKYVGDPAFVDVPVEDLLSDEYAAERACAIDPDRAMSKPTGAGDVTDYDGECDDAAAAGSTARDTENVETTNLTVADKAGNVVEYTLTIEQTGGSAITVPGRGFLLNNELTDFSYGATYDPTNPNRIQPGKRPRSSMSPTILLRNGEPFLALGSPGGSTIITTVLQTIVNRVDRQMPLPQALAAPRASQRNTAEVTAEPEFITAYGPALSAYGHRLRPAGDALTSAAEIGAATAIEFGPGNLLTAAAEPRRRGGGSARVVEPQ